jgi:5-formyltetrahydrofolate cyclo-ligase
MTETQPNAAIRSAKQAIRERVWARLTTEKAAAFPFPIAGRIPNFAGAERAAARLAELPEFREAHVVKVNPDSPQRPVRRRVLEEGKHLLMPTPRLRGGFTLVDPSHLTPLQRKEASSIAGAFARGRAIRLDEVPHIDLIVVGSVGVAPNGARVGKGEGYSELEYATLRQLGIADDAIPIATTVHDIQVVASVPLEPFDVPVDIIVSPTQTIRTTSRPSRPLGILWDLRDPERLEEMPVLRELRGHPTP